MVLPAGPTEKALMEAGDLATVATDIDEVVGSSEAGARLLALAQQQVKYVRVSAHIQQLVKSIENKNLDEKAIDTAKAGFIAQMKANGADPTGKEMPFRYRHHEIMIAVSSPLDQFMVALQFYVRCVCVCVWRRAS